MSVLGLFGAATVLTPHTSDAATAYRYWAFYVAHGSSWQFSQRGPASEYPVDGEVQGWRFAVQAEIGKGVAPRAVPDFATLCASTPAKPGQLRVGVIIDFGVVADAPAHEKPPATAVPGCVQVADGSTGAAVLQAATRVRIGTGADVGLVCGIDGYPKTECTAAVAPSAAPPTSSPTTNGPPSQQTTATQPAQAKPTAAPPALASAIAPATASTMAPTTAAPSTDQPSGTLASLRSAGDHPHKLPVVTLLGIGLIAVLGGGAVWRARAGRR